MTPHLTLGIAAFLAWLPFGAMAQDAPVPLAAPFAPISGADADLDALKWQARPIVVFADSALDPAFKEQMRYLETSWPELAARDVVVITDTSPDPASDIRTKLRPRGFSLVIIAKDGTVNLRKPAPWDAREILRSIDKMPIRREEMREMRGF
jgi:hypothetical protein